MNEWMDGWMNIWMNNEWMNEWKATKVHVHTQYFSGSFQAWEDLLKKKKSVVPKYESLVGYELATAWACSIASCKKLKCMAFHL